MRPLTKTIVDLLTRYGPLESTEIEAATGERARSVRHVLRNMLWVGTVLRMPKVGPRKQRGNNWVYRLPFESDEDIDPANGVDADPLPAIKWTDDQVREATLQALASRPALEKAWQASHGSFHQVPTRVRNDRGNELVNGVVESERVGERERVNGCEAAAAK
jgi:hypothetical protein